MSNCLPRHITDSGGSGGGAPGPPGPAGPAGPPGAAGSRWYDGAGVPSVFLGADGDYYWNTNNGDVYEKVAGAWVLTGSILGPTGAPGTPGSVWYYGAGVPGGGTGINGDFYYRTSNGDIYNKAGGVWSVVGNITGPVGPAGPAGPAGVGVPAGGGTFDLLGKIDATNYNTAWFPLYTVMDGVFGAAPGTLIQRGLGTWQALAPGSAGQVLTSNGAGTINSWQTPAGGGGNTVTLATQAGSKTISNTIIETSLIPTLNGSSVIFNASVAQWDLYRVVGRGMWIISAGGNQLIKIYLGGVLIGQTVSNWFLNSSATYREFDFMVDIAVYSIGGAGQVWCMGEAKSTMADGRTANMAGITPPGAPPTSVAINFGTNPAIDVTLTLGNASPATVATLTNLTIQRLRI